MTGGEDADLGCFVALDVRRVEKLLEDLRVGELREDPALLLVREREAVARARVGQGPTLLECKTYRWEGHVVGEQAFLGDGAYRSQTEIDEWKRKCPIIRLRTSLSQHRSST